MLANGNLSTTGTLARPRATLLLWLNLLLGPVMYEIIKTEFCHCLRFCTLLLYVFGSVVGFFFPPLQTFPRVWERKVFCTVNITAAIPALSQRCRISFASLKFCVLIILCFTVRHVIFRKSRIEEAGCFEPIQCKDGYKEIQM